MRSSSFTAKVKIILLISQKHRKKFFVGKDENSKQMTELINNESITTKLESQAFVAIRLDSDKEEYIMFAKICKL